jgi:hypothetical protein
MFNYCQLINNCITVLQVKPAQQYYVTNESYFRPKQQFLPLNISANLKYVALLCCERGIDVL